MSANVIIKREPNEEPAPKRRKVRDDLPTWLAADDQPDALPPIRSRKLAKPEYARLVAYWTYLNRYDLSRLDHWTPATGRLLKAKFLMSMVAVPPRPIELAPPIELSASRYSGLRDVDLLWHAFLDEPQYVREFSPALGHIGGGGIPHSAGIASVERVVNIEDRFIRTYTSAFGMRPEIPNPEVPLPPEYDVEWEGDDEEICG